MIHPAQGVLKVMNHPMFVTTQRHLSKVHPQEKTNFKNEIYFTFGLWSFVLVIEKLIYIEIGSPKVLNT